jgi:hypothetical protein
MFTYVIMLFKVLTESSRRGEGNEEEKREGRDRGKELMEEELQDTAVCGCVSGNRKR